MSKAASTSDGGQSMARRLCRKYGINTNLILLKITFFVMYGATAALLPYLTIHMQSIGLTVEEIAIIYLALLFTTFLSPAITGFLVDKFGKYKPVIMISLLLNAICHHSLFLIPHREIPGVVPSAFVWRQTVDGDSLEIWWSPCPSRECPDKSELELAVNNCVDYCAAHDASGHHSLPAGGHLSADGRETAAASTGQGAEVSHIRSETEDSQALPAPGWLRASDSLAVSFLLVMHPNLAAPHEQASFGMDQDSVRTPTANDFATRFGKHFDADALQRQWQVNLTAMAELDLRCGGAAKSSNMTPLAVNASTSACPLQHCTFTANAPEMCPAAFRRAAKWVFWLYFLLRFMALTMLSACITIMDPIALAMIERYGGDFGRQRMFSIIGMTIAAPVTGAMLDYFSRGLGYSDYAVVFYTYDILLGISIVTVALMPLGEKLPVDNVVGNLWQQLKRPHIIVFVFFIFVMGNFFGFTESFQFLYLKSLGATNYLLGIVIGAGTLSGVPFLYGAEKITKIFGHVSLIVIAFFSHAMRLIGYSFLKKAWWCFPLEATEGLSVHLMWVAAATYCAIVAPKNLTATLIGVLGTAHYSLGRGCGSFFGGMLMGKFGARGAFRYMGLAAAVGGVAYGLLYFLWLRKYTRNAVALTTEQDGRLAVDSGESEKYTELGNLAPNVARAAERLSLMAKGNAVGSASSLHRHSKAGLRDCEGQRRCSYHVDSLNRSPKNDALLKNSVQDIKSKANGYQ